MHFYRRNLPHMQRDERPHFITFVTKFRWVLPPTAREIVLSSCCHDHRRRYELYVAVVMTDHVHLILTPMVDEARREICSLVEILRTIKSASAHRVNRAMGRTGAVWQEESFDRALRSSENLDGRIEYVLLNPVRKGLAQDWREYPWVWRREESPSAQMTVRGPIAG